jgi:SAM-dependent methyltransferase
MNHPPDIRQPLITSKGGVQTWPFAAAMDLQCLAKARAEPYELIDLQLSPLGLRAIEALRLGSGDIVLDIGCGAGQTLLQLAERVGTEGRVIGVDVASLLLKITKRRTEPLSQQMMWMAPAPGI